uniref:DUF3536 domain-containing protein n=1 Tax=Fundidesulfovibrio putealis TaxID=270496 RepID=A0A7C4EKD0_9BACT
MDKHLCIHGHFYQPPREDPWLGTILPEGSAAPSLNWNERITRESYAPLARARRLDGSGRIVEVMNCYEWISFNAGPTLLRWMDTGAPDTLKLMLQADRDSLRRLGHGNALAQVYHHQILPLATPLDKELEIAWAVDDFQARFQRPPEGLWLAETAVDTATLEVLAAQGVAFTILAPGQARATAPLDDNRWTPVEQGGLDIRQPHLVRLPSGRSVTVFFYDGPLSQAVAFERLLADGETFWRRLSGATGPGLLSLATDGETYGHHFTFGEMALAFVLDQARRGRDGVNLTNYAAFLAANPPTRQALLHEPSAWSCAHGVERWKSDCGCTTGGHPGWSQSWRAPLRRALQQAKDTVDLHYFQRGAGCFLNPRAALVAYGKVLAGLTGQEDFAAAQMRKGLDQAEQAAAWKLLAMQQWGLASLASCAWFFDEVSRIEPVNAMTYCLRALELAQATGAPDATPQVLRTLADAKSNLPEYGDAAAIWKTLVEPRRETTESLAAQALAVLDLEERMPAPGGRAVVAWPGVGVEVAPDSAGTGTALIRWTLESGAQTLRYAWDAAPGDPLAASVSVSGGPAFSPAGLPVNKRQALADAWARRASDVLWEQACARMARGAHLVTEIQEAQTTMTLAPLWAGLWAPLAWNYLWGLDLSPKRRELLLTFLHQNAGSASERAALMQRVSGRALAELSAPGAKPDWESLRRMVARVRELALPEDWWAVQNLLWDTGLRLRAGKPLAELLGFA